MAYTAKTKSGRTIQIIADTVEKLEKCLKQFNAVLIEEDKPVKTANRIIETSDTSKKSK